MQERTSIEGTLFIYSRYAKYSLSVYITWTSDCAYTVGVCRHLSVQNMLAFSGYDTSPSHCTPKALKIHE